MESNLDCRPMAAAPSLRCQKLVCQRFSGRQQSLAMGPWKQAMLHGRMERGGVLAQELAKLKDTTSVDVADLLTN